MVLEKDWYRQVLIIILGPSRELSFQYMLLNDYYMDAMLCI